MKATPAGGGEGNWMHSVLGRAIEILRREGVAMTPADARASVNTTVAGGPDRDPSPHNSYKLRDGLSSSKTKEELLGEERATQAQ